MHLFYLLFSSVPVLARQHFCDPSYIFFLPRRSTDKRGNGKEKGTRKGKKREIQVVGKGKTDKGRLVVITFFFLLFPVFRFFSFFFVSVLSLICASLYLIFSLRDIHDTSLNCSYVSVFPLFKPSMSLYFSYVNPSVLLYFSYLCISLPVLFFGCL